MEANGRDMVTFNFGMEEKQVVIAPPGVYAICWCGNRHTLRGPWWRMAYECLDSSEFTAEMGNLAVRGPNVTESAESAHSYFAG